MPAVASDVASAERILAEWILIALSARRPHILIPTQIVPQTAIVLPFSEKDGAA
jgi:hypothetical protein